MTNTALLLFALYEHPKITLNQMLFAPKEWAPHSLHLEKSPGLLRPILV